MLRNLEMDIKEEVSVLLLGGTITATINRNIASDILKNDNIESMKVSHKNALSCQKANAQYYRIQTLQKQKATGSLRIPRLFIGMYQELLL